VLTPDITYRYLYPIDSAGPTFELVIRELNETAGATLVEVELIGIPQNKIFVLGNISMTAFPGATQSCTSLQLAGFTSAGARVLISQKRFVAVAGVIQELNWDGQVWLTGRGAGAITVQMSAVFSAAVNDNQIVTGLFGVVIPRGNAGAF